MAGATRQVATIRQSTIRRLSTPGISALDREGLKRWKKGEENVNVPLDKASTMLVRGLKGKMAMYNGCTAAKVIRLPPNRSGRRPRCVVKVQVQLESPFVEIELPDGEDNLKGFLETPPEWVAARDEHAWGATSTLNGRASVKEAMSHLLGQFERTNRRRSVSVGNDGKIDTNGLFSDEATAAKGQNKAGLLTVLLKHNIQITAADIDLLFPLIDGGSSGLVSLDELVAFSSAQRHSIDKQTRFGAHDSFLHDASNKLRKSRISDKTALQEEMGRIAAKVRAALRKVMAAKKLSARKLFEHMDRDHGGTVDRSELHIAMQELPIEISLDEMDIVWPHFELDYNGTITASEFQRFMKGRELSYTFVQDKFLDNREGRSLFLDSDKKPAPPVHAPPPTTATRWRGRHTAAKARRRKQDAVNESRWVQKRVTPVKLDPQQLEKRVELCAIRARSWEATNRALLRKGRPRPPPTSGMGTAQAQQRIKFARVRVLSELQQDIDQLVSSQESSVEAMHVANILSPRHQEDMRYRRHIRPRSKQAVRLGRIMAGANDMMLV
jgi:Ca2+-binding EF-hand superfamily protein